MPVFYGVHIFEHKYHWLSPDCGSPTLPPRNALPARPASTRACGPTQTLHSAIQNVLGIRKSMATYGNIYGNLVTWADRSDRSDTAFFCNTVGPAPGKRIPATPARHASIEALAPTSSGLISSWKWAWLGHLGIPKVCIGLLCFLMFLIMCA